MVGDAVEAGKITAEQYKEITGDNYSLKIGKQRLRVIFVVTP